MSPLIYRVSPFYDNENDLPVVRHEGPFTLLSLISSQSGCILVLNVQE